MRINLYVLLLFSITFFTLLALSASSAYASYWFQVGVQGNQSCDGASVEIQVNTFSPPRDQQAEFAFWVGVTLPHDAFIQVGYVIANSVNRGSPSWYWEYFLPGTASSSQTFLGGLGSPIGPNGTWYSFRLQSEGTVWNAYMNDHFLGKVDLHASQSLSDGVTAVAEVAEAKTNSNIMNPVDFRNLSCHDGSGWRKLDRGHAISGYGIGSSTLPSGYPFPYGLASSQGTNDSWVAGSGLPIVSTGQLLWPWYYVNVTSPYGPTSGSGWYIEGSTVMPSAPSTVTITSSTRKVLTGWHSDAYGLMSPGGVPAENSTTLTAVYESQYLVSVTNLSGVHGAGWYGRGETATLTAKSNVLDLSSPYLVGWTGNYSGLGSSISFPTNGPTLEHAVLLPNPILLLTIACALILSLMLLRRRRAKPFPTGK